MPAEQQTAAVTPNDIQQQMAETKETLGNKVKSLGNQVMGVAHSANEAVAEVIQGAKDTAHTVQDAVEHAATDMAAYAKNAIDVRPHIRRYPWLAVGCAVAVGFVCCRFFQRR